MTEEKKPEFDTENFKTVSSWVIWFNKCHRRTIGQSWAFTLAKRMNLGLIDKTSGFRYLTYNEFKAITDSVFNRELCGPVKLAKELGFTRQYIYRRLEETKIGIKNEYNQIEKNIIKGGRTGLSNMDLME